MTPSERNFFMRTQHFLDRCKFTQPSGFQCPAEAQEKFLEDGQAEIYCLNHRKVIDAGGKFNLKEERNETEL